MTLMSETIPAVFENGVFRPLRRPKGLVEHHHVTLTVDVEMQVSALAEVSGSLSPEDAQELREIVDREFERIDPREW
jgi:predicted DNA-binding antitoxin AbrB/MazE fold protein